jgi:hypothetical protein
MKLNKAKRALRTVVGDDSRVETWLRSARDRARYRTARDVKGTWYSVFRGDENRRVGVYGYGGCDVWAIREMGPALRELTGATGATYARGRASFTRSDLILQGYDGVNPDHVAEVVERLNLDPITFQPTLFEPTFPVPEVPNAGDFPKDVVVLTMATDLVRTVYQHREHGFLVDPGGFWLANDIKEALNDLDTVKWLSTTFKKVGKIDLESSVANTRRIIELVRQHTGAEVVVFNSLTVDPGRQVFDYKISHNPHRTRRREFALALVELSREMDFSVIDVDRAIKGMGVSGLGDFVKFATPHMKAIAKEMVNVLQEREVFEAVATRP